MNDETPPQWYHVTPLFLLPGILKSGGVKCGADLQAEGLPRRPSSRDEDDKLLNQLGDRRPSDCVLLFTTPFPPLLKDKLAKTRQRAVVWKAYPHALLCFCSAACLKAADYRVFGSPVNVGRALRSGGTPEIKRYRSYLNVASAKVQELLIPADCLEGRMLSLSSLRGIKCFSPADMEILQTHLRSNGHNIPVEVEQQPQYVEGQSQPPGAEFLEWTKQLYEAMQTGNEEKEKVLLSKLALTCFD